MSHFLITHLENGEPKDLPAPMPPKAIGETIERLNEFNLIEAVHITIVGGDEIIFVKGDN